MSASATPVLLWVDLRSTDSSATLLDLFSERFQIDNLNIHNPRFDSNSITPCAICFDFDYPDMHGLTLLREFHQQYPQLPIIMLTEQHSEALMLWALRARVWEILLKPMSRSTADYQIKALYDCLLAAGSLNVLREASPMLRIPEESRYHGATAETRAIHPALSYMQLHLGERVCEEQLAQFCNMRPFQFSRMFKKAYGVTFQEFLQQLRIREATRLLENPDLQILDVALTVGFRDHSYFCRVFKKYLGVTPKTFQEQNGLRSEQTQQKLADLQAVADIAPPPDSNVIPWSRNRNSA